MIPGGDVRTAYEGVDDLNAFASADQLAGYRAALLDRTAPQAAALLTWLGPGEHRVLELASGNGRLLHALAATGGLLAGTGLEISTSRVAFAQRWAEDLGLADVIAHRVADVLEPELPGLAAGQFDAVVCITGAFGYLRPLDPEAPARVLAHAARALRPQGLLCLELYYPGERKTRLLSAAEGALRLWEELPQSDRFAYYLSSYSLDAEPSTLHHEKTFIGRDGTIDGGRRESLALYTLGELTTLLEAAGFDRPVIYGGWAGEAAEPGVSPTLVLSARSARHQTARP